MFLRLPSVPVQHVVIQADGHAGLSPLYGDGISSGFAEIILYFHGVAPPAYALRSPRLASPHASVGKGDLSGGAEHPYITARTFISGTSAIALQLKEDLRHFYHSEVISASRLKAILPLLGR